MQDKARILNSRLKFLPPRIDCSALRYSLEIQKILEMMLHRAPSKRASLKSVCKIQLLEEFDLSLKNEEDMFMNQTRRFSAGLY